MKVYSAIIELLNANNITFDEIEHTEVFTSEQAAKIRGMDISMGAKALIFHADKNPVLFVIPADKKLNLSKVKKTLGIKNLAMTPREEVFSLTGLTVGCIPPFGSLLKMKYYFDINFLYKDKIAFNPGLHTKSVIMKARDLINLEQPELLEIC